MRFEKNERNIKQDIEGSITRSLHAAFSASKGKEPQEPDFVAKLVMEIPSDICKSIDAYLPDYEVAVSGVFCHQKPIADFGTRPRPELGDLLLVYIEENMYGVQKCNALLLQAKKCIRTPFIIHDDDIHQLKLYEEWPKFSLHRAGLLNDTEIDIEPKTLNCGAQYLLFQSPYRDEKKVCCAYPDRKLFPEKKLSEQIIDLMKFFTGRTFVIDYTRDDWSKLVVDMLRVSSVSSFKRKSIDIENADRLVSAGNERLLSKINDLFYGIDSNDFEEGISNIIIYTKEKGDAFQQQELQFECQ